MEEQRNVFLSSILKEFISFVFLCIALSHSDSDVIYAACGHTLRDLLMALLLLCVFSVALVVIVALIIHGTNCESSSALLGGIGVCSFLFVVGMVLILGAFTTKASIDAFNTPGCPAAMSSPFPSAYTGVPLLGIMGLVSGINSFCLGVGTCLFLCCSCLGAVLGIYAS
jgi:hypothetical protein